MVSIWDFTGTTPPEDKPIDDALGLLMTTGIKVVVEHTLEAAREAKVDPREMIPSAVSHIVNSICMTMVMTGQTNSPPIDKLQFLGGLLVGSLEPGLAKYLASDTDNAPSSIGEVFPNMLKEFFKQLRNEGVEL